MVRLTPQIVLAFGLIGLTTTPAFGQLRDFCR